MNESIHGIVSQVFVIIGATLGSEDLTSIAVGLFIRERKISPVVGVFACFMGIYLGDLGLWLLGRFAGPRLLSWPWTRRHLMEHRDRISSWFDRGGWKAIFAARFLPAARVPVYVVAGVSGSNGWRFAIWTMIAAAIWTPLLVLSVATFGETAVRPIESLVGKGWLRTLAASVAVLFAMRIIASLITEIGRAKLISKIARLWRWEFWPSWLFYLPLLPWLAWLAIRYRSLTVWTAANPGIPQGGVVGESKFDILSRLPSKWVLPSIRLTSPDEIERIPDAWPVILKPDAGQRGAGVRLIQNCDEARQYLASASGPVIAQCYHPGPHEAGIFYYRLPGEPTGHIFSITDKVFPVIEGDGHHTIEQLIWRHPRFRMQAKTYLRRHAHQRDTVLGVGETFRLALAGNHCQGTLFRDGSHLLTRELETTIDGIAQSFPGFFIGRFDVRYTSVSEFCQGRDLAIVELNGVTSESTNIYDPSKSLWTAYQVLFRQWDLLFRIGNANQRRGIQVSRTHELLQLIFGYYRSVRTNPLSD